MKKTIIPIIAIIIVGIVSAYAISPYFTESTVDEAIPSGAIIESAMEETMMEESAMEETMMEETMMEESAMEETMMEESAMEETMMEESAMEETMMEETMMEETMMEETIPISYAGKFVGVGDGIHDAQGDAYTIPLQDGSNVLRLEDFQSTNGPDLYVYLATDDNASEFINLGELKANKGNQNYQIPEDTDLDKYNKVLIWCKAFGVLFGSAELE
ncbi:DM13 domain-containing protein [Nitrosopumilus adriaticus]|uniref:Secreted protein n=1 Tax=Nitrosopumilus adriaticus TaxID=1580092 RepID=A0A0D5C518_9ARCH|nr:DM13 domain-containing protein [Nitrosopumilus adriaticus]AJW71492.1 Secreted protein [Nitrosopumilus adriaticus]